MVTIFRDGNVCLKRMGGTYFVLVNGLNVCEIDNYRYSDAKASFKRHVLAQKK